MRICSNVILAKENSIAYSRDIFRLQNSFAAMQKDEWKCIQYKCNKSKG